MRKILVANRGEIAIRHHAGSYRARYPYRDHICKRRPLYLHRFKADEAYEIGGGKGPVAAYLGIDGIITLAKDREVDATHPGYGFLSENSRLSRTCAEAGITFVGPTHEVLSR